MNEFETKIEIVVTVTVNGVVVPDTDVKINNITIGNVTIPNVNVS
jgi:predicted naringenin-chalcone synthase